MVLALRHHLNQPVGELTLRGREVAQLGQFEQITCTFESECRDQGVERQSRSGLRGRGKLGNNFLQNGIQPSSRVIWQATA